MVYLDNAATSFPKPESVYRAMDEFLRERAGNPGRSGHRLALAARQAVDDARRQLAALLNAPDPDRIIFALNTTDAINIALKGLLRPGDHVVSTSMEHNAVARPLTRLAAQGVETTWVKCDPAGLLDPQDISAAITARTSLVVATHASNVTGTIQPVAEVAELARERNLLFLLDAAQTIGCLELDVREMLVDLVAFPGHKGLLGPPGTGGLYVGERAPVTSLREGGTGSASEALEHPEQLPSRLEAGTCNSVGLCGLAEGVRYIRELGLEAIRTHETALGDRLWRGLAEVPGVRLYGPAQAAERTGIVSFTIAGHEPADVAAILDSSFDIAARAGLHCAPLAHKTLGTFPGGTVRLSWGLFNTEADVDAALGAISAIAAC